MIFESLIIFSILGFFYNFLHKPVTRLNKFFNKKLDLSKLFLSVLSALLFLIVFHIAKNNSSGIGDLIRNRFGILQAIFLFGIALGIFLGENSPGKIISSIGFFTNGLVILLNQGMPVSEAALQKISDHKTLKLLENNLVLTHCIMDKNTSFPFLGDIFVYNPFWAKGKVMSIGDVFIALGLGLMAFQMILNVKRSEDE